MKKVGTKYGLICGLVYIIYGMANILLAGNATKNQLITTLLSIVMLVATFFVIFYGVKEFRNNVNSGNLRVGEAVKLGTMIAFIGALLAAAFSLLYNYVIDPGFTERMVEQMREGMEESNMTEEQIEQTMKWTNMFRSPMLGAAFTVVWYTFWGMIKGLIAGAILKKDPAPSV